MTEELNPGESIGYFGEMEVVTVRMNTGPESTDMGNLVEEATLLIGVKMEANGRLDPDYRTMEEATGT